MNTDMSEIKFLIDRYYEIQTHRLALGNQVLAAKKDNKTTDTLEYFFGKFEDIENELKKYLAKSVAEHPMWTHCMKDIKGIGPILAASLLSEIDIRKAEHVSSVWSYCGLAVDLETGQGMKRKKGTKITWNPFLKKTCWLIGKSFVKTKGKYRTIYDTSKDFYKRKFPNEVKVEGTKIVRYTKGHLDSMAMRRATKLFLAELWETWRKQEGLSVSVPFMHRGLGDK
jgi:hypothetical protein